MARRLALLIAHVVVIHPAMQCVLAMSGSDGAGSGAPMSAFSLTWFAQRRAGT